MAGHSSCVHGYGYVDRGWENPQRVFTSDTDARPGYTSKKAHEYQDTEEVLNAKVKELINLMKNSKQTVLYTGAGISTAAGLGDYASAENSEHSAPVPGDAQSATDKNGNHGEASHATKRPPKLRSLYEAQPTHCHRVLTDLCHKKFDLIQCWIQQNHDGLPQKAGFPQYKMNEIHGSWFDPSNPVIFMSGTLRTDLFENLLSWEGKASLVVALGTSLCGMNADRVCDGAWRRNTEMVTAKATTQPSLGLVLCNLQETVYDEKCVLRIFCDLENLATVMERLLNEDDTLQSALTASDVPIKDLNVECTEEDIFYVPYDGSTGKRNTDENELLRLDLREDAVVKLTSGQFKGDEGEVVGKQLEGHYKIRFKHALKPGAKLKMPFERILGTWWVKQAQQGLVEQIPLVNV